MVAAFEIPWEEASAPGFKQTTWQFWRKVVRLTLPHLRDTNPVAIA
jgi:hypothetical protein